MLRKAVHRSSPRRPAAAALEFALLLPFLALMVSLVVDFGRVLFVTQVLQTAASNGAAAASGATWVPAAMGTPSDAGKAAACAEGATLSPALQASQVNVNISGGMATVTVDYDLPMITGVLYPNRVAQLRRTATAPVVARPGD